MHDPLLHGVPGVVEEIRRAGISRCVVNATSEHDWSDVARLARNHPDLVIPAFGIHPWNSHWPQNGWLDRLHGLLLEFPHSGIGECGVDGWVATPAMETQIPVFLAQIRLARDLERPLTIHALQAWDALFRSFAEQPPPPRFLIHSFAGSWDVAERLRKLGAFFGFSGHFLHPGKHKVRDVFRRLPADRIVLETDAPYMTPPLPWQAVRLPEQRNHPANLPLIGEELARILGMPSAKLAEITQANARACFVF
jgi:TatD DNase family protein